MKKSISALSASLLLACNSTAALPFSQGSNMVVIFSTVGQGSFYIDSGVSSDDIVDGAGFSIDIGAASAALGGTIESFAVLGRNRSTYASYNYSELLYTDPGQGLLYAQSSAGIANRHASLQQAEFALLSGLANANFGYNAPGSLGDINSPFDWFTNAGNGFGDGFLNAIDSLSTGLNNIRLFHQYDSAENTSFQTTIEELSRVNQQAIAICSSGDSGYESFEQCMEFYDFPYSGAPAFVLEDNIFTLRSTEIPLPSTAWLFLSAGTGLMLSRRLQR